MLRQGLSQKLLQKLSPQQIQLMKLLQVPTATLEQRIKEELELNPALEEGGEYEEISAEVLPEDNDNQTSSIESSSNETTTEVDTDTDFETEKFEESSEYDNNEVDLSEYLDEDSLDQPDYKTASTNQYNEDDEKDKTLPVAIEVSFHETLLAQLGLLELDNNEYHIAEQLIGSIDDDGYLRRDLDAIVDDLAFTQNISTTEEELEHILKKIQTFEPYGVGARDLRECLLIQLYRKEKSEINALCIKVIDKYFEVFSKKHYDRLLKDLSVDEDTFKKVIHEIIHLNPKPGSGVGGNNFETQIIPDFIITNTNDELILTLNALNAPELKISNDFKDMMKTYKTSKDKSAKDAVLFIKQKLDSARWFIDAIKQRQETMMATMQTIMRLQYNFFLTGDESDLRPMILKDVAERTDLDISTISRVVNSKYVQTEFGTFILKYFFSEAVATDSGEEVSTREVKKYVTELVENENKKRPLSDEQLTTALQEKGYNVARRTVAKYREQLGYAVARLRKEL